MKLLISVLLALVAVQQAPPLRIVVIEGEGAVNIIQQKTAVAPLIEVRDRNDQPVAGAVVNFVIRNGRATFGGARTLSVTTNAAGRAVAAGFAPSGSGALQIGATATFQGQSAAAITIAQTNVMTVAEAAAASTASASSAGGSGGGGGAAGGGAGAGGGGGLSTTTLAIVGGAVAGGAVVAKETLAGASGTTFTGQFSGVMADNEVAAPEFGPYSCTRQETQTGTIKITLEKLDAPVQGMMQIEGNLQTAIGTCTADSPRTGQFHLNQGNVTGSRDNVTGTGREQFNFTSTGNPGSGTHTYDFTFTGRFDGDQQITGSLTFDRTVTFRQAENRYASTSRGVITFQVTLRK